MAYWLDRPAGKHGFVQVRGDRLVFEDGAPVKFWGTNVCNGRVARPKDGADRVADRFAKYGVNLVRMHKFTWPGERSRIGSAADSTLLDETVAGRWDYLGAALAQRGIYSAWPHIFGHRLSPADRARVAAYDELMNANLPWDYLRRSTIGLVNFAPDLQHLNIALTVNMLNRVNTATGRRYADDPALAFIELQNEDDLFWGHTQIYLDRCPTYKRMFHEQFSTWLRSKYGSEAKLLAAWGKGGLAAGECLDQSNVAGNATTEMFGSHTQSRSRGRTGPAAAPRQLPLPARNPRTSSTRGSPKPSAPPATKARSLARAGRRQRRQSLLQPVVGPAGWACGPAQLLRRYARDGARSRLRTLPGRVPRIAGSTLNTVHLPPGIRELCGT